METLPILVDLVEVVTVMFGLLIALKKKKAYGWLIAAAFAIYVVADTAGYAGIGSVAVLEAIMVLAAPIALVAFLMVYKEK